MAIWKISWQQQNINTNNNNNKINNDTTTQQQQQHSTTTTQQDQWYNNVKNTQQTTTRASVQFQFWGNFVVCCAWIVLLCCVVLCCFALCCCCCCCCVVTLKGQYKPVSPNGSDFKPLLLLLWASTVSFTYNMPHFSTFYYYYFMQAQCEIHTTTTQSLPSYLPNTYRPMWRSVLLRSPCVRTIDILNFAGLLTNSTKYLGLLIQVSWLGQPPAVLL